MVLFSLPLKARMSGCLQFPLDWTYADCLSHGNFAALGLYLFSQPAGANELEDLHSEGTGQMGYP